jgi:hypothetical protein
MLSELEKISDGNEQSLILYARLWQLERWLREMVYVELKVKKGASWINFNKTKRTYEADKELTHIPTADQNPLNYTTFSDLTKLIGNNWDLFSTYLPPQVNWNVKIEEIVHIRNRVAHFRQGHSDDLDRLIQLMRDIDLGFWKFCTDYNDMQPILPPDSDPVSKKYIHLDPFSFKEVAPNEWAQVGSAPAGLAYVLKVNSLKRTWAQNTATIDGVPGYLYDVTVVVRGNRQLDYAKFLEGIKEHNSSIVHICLDTFSKSARITIPAVFGSEKVMNIIDATIPLMESSMVMARNINSDDQTVHRLSESWPEYVLGPKNPLTFLCPDMPCSFFNVLKD